MKTIKITNHGSGDYTVDVNHAGNKGNTSHDFDNHARLTDFVSDLKSQGYLVVNDLF